MPPLHEPGESYTVSVVASAQWLAGGDAHVTPMHGSPAQAPPAQPFGQLVVDDAYEQLPWSHVPVAENTCSVLASTQAFGGGDAQVTPTHGSCPPSAPPVPPVPPVPPAPPSPAEPPVSFDASCAAPPAP